MEFAFDSRVSSPLTDTCFFSGLCIGVSVLEGNFQSMFGEMQTAKLSIKRTITEEGVKGFSDVVISRNISDGVCHL